MRDLVFIAYLGMLFLLAFRRPYLFAMTYVYVDIVAPQRLKATMAGELAAAQRALEAS